jgi:hypothetical protein
MSGAKAGFQRCLADMSGLHPGYIRIFDTPTGRFLLRAIKEVHTPFTPLATPLTRIHFEPTLLELKPSLLQASLKFKLPKRDLSHPLSDPLNLQAKHFTNDLRVFVILGDMSPRWTRCSPGATKVVEGLRKFVLPSPSWGFDSEKLN